MKKRTIAFSHIQRPWPVSRIPSNSVDWATAVVVEADRELTCVTLTYQWPKLWNIGPIYEIFRYPFRNLSSFPPLGHPVPLSPITFSYPLAWCVQSNLSQVTLETGISSGALFAPKLYYFLTKVRSLCFILIENMKNVVEYGRFWKLGSFWPKVTSFLPLKLESKCWKNNTGHQWMNINNPIGNCTKCIAIPDRFVWLF